MMVSSFPAFADTPACREARDVATPPDRLVQIAGQWDGAVLAASYPDCPLALIAQRSATYAHCFAVTEALAANPNAPFVLLRRLLPVVPAAVLANPMLPLLFLERPGWLHDLSEAEAGALLRQADLPPHFARILARHPHPAIAADAALHVSLQPTLPRLWEAMAHGALTRHPFPYPSRALSRYGVLSFFHLPGLLPMWLWEALAHHQDGTMVALALRFAPLPAALLPTRQDDFVVQSALQKMKEEMQPYWFFPSNHAFSSFSAADLAPQKLAEYLQSTDWSMRWQVANYDAVPPSLLVALAHDPVLPVAVLAVSRLPDELALQATVLRRLWRTLAANMGAFHRLVAYAGTLMSAEWLLTHSRTPFWVERYALARNPRTPLAVLATLAADGNALIRAAALALLRTHFVAQLALPPSLLLGILAQRERDQ